MMNTWSKTRFTSFEQEVLSVASDFFAQQADAITSRLQAGLSCEWYLNHLFSKAFTSHQLICVRESPYVDLGATGTAHKTSLDLMVISPDKAQIVFIETKQVHDRTENFYRNRLPKYGDSIAGDIKKIAAIPSSAGRTRLVVLFMTNLSGEGNLADWIWWLTNVSILDIKWSRTTVGDGPLFKIGESGWFDILIYKLDQ